MTTQVIHIRDSQKSPNYIYIGRPGKGQSGVWGNPVIKGKVCPVCSEQHSHPAATLPCYEQYLRERLVRDDSFRGAFLALKDKTLFCFCCPKDGFGNRIICHGQVMAHYLDKEWIDNKLPNGLLICK